MSSSDVIRNCMQLLGGATDEHKLAGLLMITRNLSGCDEATRKQLYDGIGNSFIHRLLATSPAMEKDDHGKSQPISSFQSLGLNVLSAFLADGIVKPSDAKALLPKFLLWARCLPTEHSNAWVDATHCAISIAQDMLACGETNKLIALDFVSAIASGISTHGQAYEAARSAEAALLLAKGDDVAACISASDSIGQTILAACCSLMAVMNEIPSAVMKLGSMGINDLSALLLMAKTSIKLDLLKLVACAIDSLASLSSSVIACAGLTFPSSPLLVDAGELWVTSVRQALWELCRSRVLTVAIRDDVFRIINSLFSLLGDAWTQVGAGDASNTKFVLLIARLVGIEVKVLLEDAEKLMFTTPAHAESIKAFRDEDGSTAKRVDAMVPVLFGIVESYLRLLSASLREGDEAEAPLWAAFSSHEILALHESLCSTVKLALEIISCAALWLEGTKSRAFPSASVTGLLQACLRVLGVWIADEAEAMHTELCDCMPALLRVVHVLQGEGLGSTQRAALVTLLPGLMLLTAEIGDVASAFKEAGGVELLVSSLSSLMAGSGGLEEEAWMAAECGVLSQLIRLDTELLQTHQSLFLLLADDLLLYGRRLKFPAGEVVAESTIHISALTVQLLLSYASLAAQSKRLVVQLASKRSGEVVALVRLLLYAVEIDCDGVLNVEDLLGDSLFSLAQLVDTIPAAGQALMRNSALQESCWRLHRRKPSARPSEEEDLVGQAAMALVEALEASQASAM